MAVTLCKRSISSLEMSVNLVLIFSLLAPHLGYTAGISKVADTLAVKLT